MSENEEKNDEGGSKRRKDNHSTFKEMIIMFQEQTKTMMENMIEIQRQANEENMKMHQDMLQEMRHQHQTMLQEMQQQQRSMLNTTIKTMSMSTNKEGKEEGYVVSNSNANINTNSNDHTNVKNHAKDVVVNAKIGMYDMSKKYAYKVSINGRYDSSLPSHFHERYGKEKDKYPVKCKRCKDDKFMDEMSRVLNENKDTFLCPMLRCKACKSMQFLFEWTNKSILSDEESLRQCRKEKPLLWEMIDEYATYHDIPGYVDVSNLN